MTEAAHVLTADEYLERERQRDAKHELVHGVEVAMAGATPKHNAIAMNLGAALEQRLRGRRCLVFPSEGGDAVLVLSGLGCEIGLA